jgi:NAD(P)-dependent dehydrogenase (short-subunit alcohol dehydrogenase family)
MSPLFDLSGKVALVTGGSRGIGMMIATGLLDHGARVYICSRKAEVCDQAARELSAHGTCISLPTDLARREHIDRLVQELGSRENRLDILVNNAGATWGASIDAFPQNGWDKVLNLNLKSVFFLTQQLLPLLERPTRAADDPARVINIGSIDGMRVTPVFEAVSYGASKAGLHFLTRILAARLASRNITVNAIAPGFFDTDMLNSALDAKDASVAQRIPLGRVGYAEDIAGVAVMLAARAGALITGVVLPVDGGIVGAGAAS